MKIGLRFGFFLALIFLCACAVPTYQSKVDYFEKEKDYKITILSDFDKCRKVGLKIFDNDKLSFETWEKGGGAEKVFLLNDKILKEGDNLLKIYCDEKEYPRSLNIKNSRFLLMNILNHDNENFYSVASQSKELFSNETFFQEFKSLLLSDKEKYYKYKDLTANLPVYFKVQLFDEITDRYRDEITLRSVATQLGELLSEEKTENLIIKLYGYNNLDVDKDLTYVILSKPVKRYYEKFFPVMVKKEHVYPIIMEHLRSNGDSEFSELTFNYIKESAEKGEMTGFVVTTLSLFLEKLPSPKNFVKALLTSGDSKKEELALKILRDQGIDSETGNFIIENWDRLGENVRKNLVYDMMKLYGKDVSFFKKFLNTEDMELRNIMYKVGLEIDSRYSDKDIINFYLVGDSSDTYIYFLNAPNDIKFRGLSSYYEKNPQKIAILLDIGQSAPEYFATKLIENFLLKKDSLDKVIAAQNLVVFKEKYLPQLIAAYEAEKDVETRQGILAAIAEAGDKGVAYAYEKVKNEPHIHTIDTVYANIGKHAEGEILADILKNIETLPDKVFIPLSMGFENARKKFDCGFLKNIYKGSNNKDVIFRVIWTWAYCCPDTYFDMFKGFANQMSEVVFLEAIDGVRDIIKDVKPALLDEGFRFLEDIYSLKKTKAVREKLVDVILDAGKEKQYNFLLALFRDAEDEQEKLFFSERIHQFKNEKNIRD